MVAKRTLEALYNASGDVQTYNFHDYVIRNSSLKKGIKYYDIALRIYIGAVMKRHKLEVPKSNVGTGKWTDLSGMLLPVSEEERIIREIKEGNGGYGKWRACQGPQSYFWGGTWICGAYGSDNIAITRDIMLKMTCDTATMKSITENEQDYTNNKAAIKELIDGGYSNPFLGGQDHLSLLSEAADKIDLTGKVSAYDQGCNEEFQGAMKDYFLGNATYEEALATFKTNITTKYGDLTMD